MHRAMYIRPKYHMGAIFRGCAKAEHGKSRMPMAVKNFAVKTGRANEQIRCETRFSCCSQEFQVRN